MGLQRERGIANGTMALGRAKRPTAELSGGTWDADAKSPLKKGKVALGPDAVVPAPEDLTQGCVVLYWGKSRGVVRDAYVLLDEFWIADEAGELVRDESGDIVPFKASELQLLSSAPEVPPLEEQAPKLTGPAGSVFLLGTETQMMRVLQHFGSPSSEERHDPQQLLAIPCSMCKPEELLQIAAEGVDDNVRDLAQRLRPDIHVALRATHLKHALQQLGGNMSKMSDYYCLASVQVPFDLAEIEACEGYEKKLKKDANQIDLGVTASKQHAPGEDTVDDTAKKALGMNCGISISDAIWTASAQSRLRELLGAAIPLTFQDTAGAKVFVVVLPAESATTLQDDILCFGAAPGINQPEVVAKPVTEDAVAPSVQGKTIGQWEAEQEAFADQIKLPAGWLRIKSRSSGEVYYYNKRTQEATFEQPLPEGWTKELSKSTGKVYYFNAKKKESTFDRPTV